MKLPEVKRLSEAYSLEQLQSAEHALLEGEAPGLEVHGTDEGEQLTHILGAIDVLKRMETGLDRSMAFREFCSRVRDSIG